MKIRNRSMNLRIDESMYDVSFLYDYSKMENDSQSTEVPPKVSYRERFGNRYKKNDSSSDRVSRIMNFVNNNETKQDSEQIQQTDSQTNSQTNSQTKPNQTNDVLSILKQQQPDIETFLEDQKQYNALRKKFRKQKSFPCNISGFIFQNEEELNDFCRDMTNRKKQYNKEQRSKQIRETKLNIQDLEELNDENTIEEDGAIYSTKNPIGIKSNDKVYRLPRTNTRDRKQTFEEIRSNKDLVTDLLQTDDETDFKNKTVSNIKNQQLKKRMKNHFDNDIVNDRTWNRNEFLRMMEQLMNDNSSMKQRLQSIEESAPKKRAKSLIEEEFGYQFNPKLFQK